MDDLDELDDLDVLDGSLDTTYKGKTPAGIIALTILTMIGSAFILLKDFYTYAFYSVASNISEKFSDSFGSQFDTFFGTLPLIYLAEVISCLGTIAAAILMLRLKLVGFYIYIASTALYGIAIIWFWFMTMRLNLDEGLIVIFLLYLAAPIGFIILYSAHKKYLS